MNDFCFGFGSYSSGPGGLPLNYGLFYQTGNNVNITTFNTTISNTLNVTAQWDSASTSNYIHSDIFVLQKIF